MKKTYLIKITDSRVNELACGNCKSVLLGYDEVICPSCGAYVDMDNVKKMKEEELNA